jgi:dolichol-phosphate mannosyltransferase
MAGLEYAGGDAVITIDADLQDPPESIPEMIDRWQSGFDVVYGIRTGRPGESAFKIWTARLFYGLIARIADIRIPREAGDFRLMDKSVVEVLRAMPERDRFTRGLTSWAGFEQVAVPFSRSARVAGKSKYSTKRMVRFAMDAITSFSTLPLRLAMWSGFLFLGLALITIIVAASLWLLRDVNISGSILTIVAVFLIGGIQLVCLGIMGEYLGRIHGESKRRPLYILKERLGFEENAELKASVLKSGSRFTRS